MKQDLGDSMLFNRTLEEPPFLLFGNITETTQWMEKNWTWSLYAIAFYLNFLYFGQKYMKNRAAYNLENALVFWNFALAAFSINACVTLVPETIRYLFAKNGWHNSVCFWLNDTSDSSIHLFWIFVLSKMVELFDTVFIVLRKKQLSLLHWYHHISVFLYCWYTYSQQSSAVPWFINMNYFVHSIMYTYYGLRAMKINVPKSIAMTITALQLIQMVVGLAVNIYAYKMITNNIECGTPMENIQISFAMYASYFLLFVNFFYNSYFSNNRGKRISSVKEN